MIGSPVFAYLGPETALPVASVFTAVIGVVLMAWQRLLAIARRALVAMGLMAPPPPEEPEAPAPPESSAS